MKLTIETEPRLKEITEEMFPFFTKYVGELEEITAWYCFKDNNKYYNIEIGCNCDLNGYDTLDDLIEDFDIENNILVNEVVFK